MSQCRDTRQHHSDDTVTVFVGRPHAVTLCGYHATANVDSKSWATLAGYDQCEDERDEYMDGPIMVTRCKLRKGHDGLHRHC